MKLEKLRERLKKKKLSANALEDTYPGMTATAGITAAFEVSWDLLNSQTQILSCLLSLFASAPIPWYLVQDCLPNWDEEDLEDCRDDLVSLHLLKRLNSEIGESYQLHQLLREFFATKLEKVTNAKDLIERFWQAMTDIAALLNSGMNLWSSRYWHIPKLEIVNQQSDGMLQHH